MTPSWMPWVENAVLGQSLMSILIGATIRGALLLLLAAIIVRLLPRASAAQRHAVWMVTCYSLLLLPLVVLVVPAWRVQVSPAYLTLIVDKLHVPNQPAIPVTVHAARYGASIGLGTTPGRTLSAVWPILVLLGWGGGTLVVLAVLINSQRQVRRLVSEAIPLTDARILAVVARARTTVRIARAVPVKLHPSAAPMVCGVLRPVIILPMSVCTWEEERLYNVFLHELAHVKRYDSVTQTVAALVSALYWYNPLVWFTVRTLQTEQEQACDDVVLIAGNRPRDYATDLLELTQAFQAIRVSVAAIPFARPSQLHTRLQSIVDRSRRRGLVSRWGALAVWSTGLGLMYPLASLVPQLGNPGLSAQQQVGRSRSTPFRRMTGTQPENKVTNPMESRKMKKSTATSMLASTAMAGLLAGTPARGHAQSVHTTTPMVGGLSVPGNPSRIRLGERGGPVAADTTDPLIVVDGVRLYADSSSRSPLDKLDRNKIETIEVFKGPAALATFGPDAAHGVIVITLKKK